MKAMFPLLLGGTCLVLASTAQAQPAPPRSPWGIGVATAVSDSVYAGEGTRVLPIPLLSYETPRFHFRGLTAGWRVAGDDALEVSLLAKARLDGFDADDLGRRQLAANGVDRDALSDRDKGLDLGLGMDWSGRGGKLQLELLSDATNRSGGQEASLQYGYPLRIGATALTPQIGASWQSADLADYYYGTLEREIARGAPRYRPGAVTVPHLGVSLLRPLGTRWALVGNARYSRLPSALADSPLVQAGTDGSLSLFVGVSRGFTPWWVRPD